MIKDAKKSVSRDSLPILHNKRSRFMINDHHPGTCNLGELRILDWRLCVPGDQFKIKERKILRTQPLVSSPMDALKFDTFWFKMDLRDLWDNFTKFCGESSTKWRPDSSIEYLLPQIDSGRTGFEVGSVADDLGLPVNVSNIEVMSLPFRMYAEIVNHFFRSTVVEDELYIPKGDEEQAYFVSNSLFYTNSVVVSFEGFW